MRKKKPPAKGVPQRESLGYEMRKKKPPAGGCRGLDFIPDGGGEDYLECIDGAIISLETLKYI